MLFELTYGSAISFISILGIQKIRTEFTVLTSYILAWLPLVDTLPNKDLGFVEVQCNLALAAILCSRKLSVGNLIKDDVF